MSIIQQANEKITQVRNELAEFILNKVKPSMYPNSAGTLEWIPADMLDRRNSYIIYDEQKSKRIAVAGFNIFGVIVEDMGGWVYKSFKQFSTEELMMIAGWVETEFDKARADVAKAVAVVN